MGAPECVVIGDAELWWGRWEEVYSLFPRDGAIVSDPPYGMNWDTDSTRFSGGACPWTRGKVRHAPQPIVGDDAPFDPTPWLDFPQVILWGSNHFAQRLPVGTTLVWIKRKDRLFGSFLSDAEVAWMKGGHGVYCFQDTSLAGTLTGSRGDFTPRLHPCQKPLPLMQWCIEKTTGVVIDPFAGSFTTAVAALQLGRRFVGCEGEKKYWEIGCKRVEEAHRQLQLFPPPAPVVAPAQLSLMGKAVELGGKS